MKPEISYYQKQKREKQNRKVKRNVLIGLLTIAILSIVTQYVYLAKDMGAVVPDVYAKEDVELPMKEYVLNEVRKAGIDEYKAYMIIYGESRWNTEATLVNKDGSIDRGLWQINNKYQPQVSNACAYDYVCATKEAIKIIKKQGFKPWVVAQKMGLTK